MASLVKTYQDIYLFVTNHMPNPFAACSGSLPQCSTFLVYLSWADIDVHWLQLELLKSKECLSVKTASHSVIVHLIHSTLSIANQPLKLLQKQFDQKLCKSIKYSLMCSRTIVAARSVNLSYLQIEVHMDSVVQLIILNRLQLSSWCYFVHTTHVSSFCVSYGEQGTP